MSLWTRRLAELGGMAMIGDGMIAALDPKGHVALWERGPWRGLLKPFADHPQVTRGLGIAEVLLGSWMAFAAIGGTGARR